MGLIMNKTKKIPREQLVEVDMARINSVIDAYFYWEKLNIKIKTISGSRGINFPSELSEYMACYALGLLVNKSKTHGDAMDPKNKKIIEIKGSSADSEDAPNSFSPDENFDDLVYVRLIKKEDCLKIYRTGINSNDLKSIKVSKTQTVGDQQKQKRRPRFSIQRKIVEDRHLEPDATFYIRDRTITYRTGKKNKL